MDDDKPAGAEAGIATRTMEIAVAVVLLAFGALVVFDSVRLGASWGDDGPQSGYFPFYIGGLLCLAALATIAQVAYDRWKERGQFRGAVAASRRLFVGWGSLRQVLAVLVPAAVYVLLVQLVGIYVASTLYIAVFMVWLGKYSWLRSAALALAVSAALFAMFEIWFKVPLFRGSYDLLSWLPV